MALYTSRGTIKDIFEVASGVSKAGNEWTKVMVVLEVPGYEGQFTLQAFTAFGDKALLCEHYDKGQKVEVVWTMKAKEWQGKYYTDIDLVNISTPEQAEQRHRQEQPQSRRSPIYDRIEKAQADPADNPNNDLPF